jgi:hypothetical protein
LLLSTYRSFDVAVYFPKHIHFKDRNIFLTQYCKQEERTDEHMREKVDDLEICNETESMTFLVKQNLLLTDYKCYLMSHWNLIHIV